MKVLIDTCVVIDLLQKREPFFRHAERVFLAVANDQAEGFVSSKAVTDIWYLMHRYLHDDRRTGKAMETLLKLIAVLDTKGADCRKALLSPVKDYEDAVMTEIALREGMDCIITRNIRDFSKSPIRVYSPEEYVGRFLEAQ